MGVAYRRIGEPRQTKVEFLNVCEERRIMLLGPPEHHVQVYLHFIGKHSVPCLGDDCELCGTPPVLYGYAAAALLLKPAQGPYRQVPVILPVTDGALGMLETDLRRRHIFVSRLRQSRTGKMCVRIGEHAPDAEVALFDIKTRLESLWSSRSRVQGFIRLHVDGRRQEDIEENGRCAG